MALKFGAVFAVQTDKQSPSSNLSLLLGYSSSQAEHTWRNGPERRIEDARKVPGSKAGKLKVSKHCVALWCSAKRV